MPTKASNGHWFSSRRLNAITPLSEDQAVVLLAPETQLRTVR